MPKFKLFGVDKVISIYLIGVFAINIYLLYVLYDFLKSIIPDDIDVNLFVAKSLVLIILTFVSFGVYLHTQTKRSILFFLGVVCLGFTTILDYINAFFLFDLNFVVLQSIFYATGLYLIFSYALIESKLKKLKEVESKQEKTTYSSDNILA